MRFFTIILTVLDWTVAPALLCYYLYRRYKRKGLDKVPGPRSKSFLYGNLHDLYHADAGQTEFQWYAEYGPIVKFHGVMGEQILLISDPKALHHIFQFAGYAYPRDYMRQMLSKSLGARGLTDVEGDDHRRQRRIMQPSFGAAESKALVPIFFFAVQKMTSKWIELLNATSQSSVVLDMPSWVSRAALDAIGLGAFDYDIGALDNSENELSKVYKNIFRDIFSKPSKSSMLTLSLFKYLPQFVTSTFLRWSAKRSPRMSRLKQLLDVSRSVSKRLLEERSVIHDSAVKKDVLTRIVAANVSENPRLRLELPEMTSLMSTTLLAGHETTANTLSWATLELCKYPECQTKLRQEIQAMERAIRERGDTEFSVKDFDTMPYLTAVVKEVLRLHPAASFIQRNAGTDDLIPLSKPLVLKNGEVVNELFVPKGTTITASIAAYNRTPEIFGADPHYFNPDRWLKGDDDVKNGTSIGVYGNMFTFSGGVRSCIGWRFAVMELHAFIITIFGKFELELAVDPQKVKRVHAGVMIPLIDGEEEKGVQLPVRVKLAARFGDEL